MRRAILRIGLAVVPLLSFAVPVSAGGWATVRLDQPPGEIVINVPWTVGFTVLQHDLHPTNDVDPRLNAMHRETGTTVDALGHQEGAEGHFVAEVTFPLAGNWKWLIAPDPFAPTSFETLAVASKAGEALSTDYSGVGPSADLLGARIATGTCADGAGVDGLALMGGPGDSPVNEEQAGPVPVGRPTAIPVQTGHAFVDATLDALVSARHALVVPDQAGSSATAIACGDIGGTITPEGLAIGLGERNGSGHTGVAVFKDAGARTEVRIYLTSQEATDPSGPVAAGPDAEIRIANGVFQPATLTVPAGTIVIWRNDDAIAHTIMGDQLVFNDSGVLDRNQTFSQALTQPGTYRYQCGPHPWMQGTVVVE